MKFWQRFFRPPSRADRLKRNAVARARAEWFERVDKLMKKRCTIPLNDFDAERKFKLDEEYAARVDGKGR